MTKNERFWGKVEKSDYGCWLWKGYLRYGYGIFATGGRGAKRIMAHRYAYQEMVGVIPEGLVLDHLCRVRNCVNPAHLEPVTIKTNILRGVGPSATQAKQINCKRGHNLYGDNLYVTPKGKRQCRACRCEAMRQFYERKK